MHFSNAVIITLQKLTIVLVSGNMLIVQWQCITKSRRWHLLFQTKDPHPFHKFKLIATLGLTGEAGLSRCRYKVLHSLSQLQNCTFTLCW